MHKEATIIFSQLIWIFFAVIMWHFVLYPLASSKVPEDSSVLIVFSVAYSIAAIMIGIVLWVLQEKQL